jgi:hypothetical protein
LTVDLDLDLQQFYFLFQINTLFSVSQRGRGIPDDII